jgi:hypothetical protein
MGKDRTEPGNLLNYYFGPGTAAYGLMDLMRERVCKGEALSLDANEIGRARAEVAKKRELLDNSYLFSQDLAAKVLGEKKPRTVLLVNGIFYSPQKNIASCLPIDLGNNPYQLFRADVAGTIDDYVTETQTKAFLSKYKHELLADGYKMFEVRSSRFFYIREKDFAEFVKEKGSLENLATMISEPPSYGSLEPHIVLNRVESPIPGDYMKRCPNFISYRFKRTLAHKVMKKLCENRPDYFGIKDWVAFTLVVDDLQDVVKWQEFFESSPKIGRSKVKFVRVKDYYNEPKENGFRAKVNVLDVSTKGDPFYITELQIVDKAQHFENEINPNSTARHANHDKKKRPAREDRKYAPVLMDYLNGIFGNSTADIHIGSLEST